jgi:hypothetical protein
LSSVFFIYMPCMHARRLRALCELVLRIVCPVRSAAGEYERGPAVGSRTTAAEPTAVGAQSTAAARQRTRRRQDPRSLHRLEPRYGTRCMWSL